MQFGVSSIFIIFDSFKQTSFYFLKTKSWTKSEKNEKKKY